MGQDSRKRQADAGVSALDAHLGYWLRYVSNHVSHGFARKVATRGVTVSEWVLLRQLYADGATSPGALAVAMGMSKGAVSKLMARLQAKALIEVALAAGDRRRQTVRLTPKGRALVPVLARLADQNDVEFFGHMTKVERWGMAQALRALVARHDLRIVPID